MSENCKCNSCIIVGYSSKINFLLPTDNSWKDESTEIPVKMTLIILITGLYFPDRPKSTLAINCYVLPLQFSTKLTCISLHLYTNKQTNKQTNKNLNMKTQMSVLDPNNFAPPRCNIYTGICAVMSA